MISIPVILLLSLSFLALVPIAVPAVHAADTAPVISPAVGDYEYPSTITVTVTWTTTGSDTYTLTLYSMKTDSCLGPFTAPNAVAITPTSTTGSAGDYVVSFSAPSSAALYLCAVVTNTTLSTTLTSGVGSYVLVTPLASYINNDESYVAIDNGQVVVLTDYVSGGTPSYLYTWYGPVYSLTETPPTSPCTGTVAQAQSTNATLKTIPAPSSTPATAYYGVKVTDSTSPGAPSTTCELATVYVHGTFSSKAATFEVDSQSTPINGQVGSGPLTAVVTWPPGTGPWYTVTIVGGTDSTCAGATTIATLNDINATEAILSIPQPAASTIMYYCAEVTDMSQGYTPMSTALTGVSLGPTLVLGPVQVDTSPALSAPSFLLLGPAPTYAASVDYTYPTQVSITLTALMSWAGGTAPYTVYIFSGSSSNCALDTTGPISVFWNGAITAEVSVTTSDTSASATWASPASSTYYCAVVQDSSVSAVGPSITASATSEFVIEGLLAVNAPTASSYLTEVVSPVYEGTPDTITVTWSGGTGPYTVTLYQDTSTVPTSCGSTAPLTSPWSVVQTYPGSNPVTGVSGTSATFGVVLTGTLPGSYYYCATVTDSTGATAISGAPSKPIVVAPVLTNALLVLNSGQAPATLGPPGTDTGQTEPATATVTWTGGTAPYTVTLYSGTSPASCNLDTTMVTSMSGIYTTSAALKFTSPSTTTFYCATVTDSSVPTSIDIAGPVVWATVPPPSVSFVEVTGYPHGSFEVEAGTSANLYAIINVTGTVGTTSAAYKLAPDFLTWFIGSGCVAANAISLPTPAPITTFPITTPLIGGTGSLTSFPWVYNTGVISTTTTYSVLLTDSSAATPALSSCANIVVTVNNGPSSIAVFSTGPSAGLVYSTCTSPESYNALCVIDSDSNTLITTIPLTYGANPLYPTAVAVMTCGGSLPCSSYPGGLVYVAGTYDSAGDGALCYVNPTTNTELGCQALPAGSYPDGIAVNNVVDQVYVANSGTDSVSVNTVGVGITATVPVGPSPAGVAVDPNNYNVFVADAGGNTVSIMQPVAPYYLVTSTLGWTVTTATVGFEPTGVAFNPLNGNVYVTNSGSGTVTELSGSNYQVLATIKTGGEPSSIVIDTASNTAYVSDALDNVVIPINLATNAPSATTIPVGNNPSAMAFFLSPVVSSATPNLVYVANSGSNFISVINPATGLVVATIVLPS